MFPKTTCDQASQDMPLMSIANKKNLSTLGVIMDAVGSLGEDHLRLILGLWMGCANEEVLLGSPVLALPGSLCYHPVSRTSRVVSTLRSNVGMRVSTGKLARVSSEAPPFFCWKIATQRQELLACANKRSCPHRGRSDGSRLVPPITSASCCWAAPIDVIR
jgi:hypothetical protein